MTRTSSLRRPRRLSTLLLAGLLCSACGDEGETPPRPSAGAGGDRVEGSPDGAPAVASRDSAAPPAAVPSEEAVSQLSIGVRRLEQFRYEEAAQRFERALELEPGWLPAQVDLAVAHLNDVLSRGHAERAEAAARRALETSPGDARATYVLAYALSEQQRRFEEALPLLRHVVEARPDDAHAWYQLGRAAEEAGQADDDAALRSEAEAAYRRALELDPRMGEANYKLARLLVDSEDPERQGEGMELLERHEDILRGRPPVQQNYLTRGELARAWPWSPEPPDVPEPAFVPLRRGEPLQPPPFRGVEASKGLSPDRYFQGLTLADFDGDGRADLLAPRREPSQPAALLWTGEDGGGFRSPRALGPQGLACSTAAVGDFERDGDLDAFLTCNAGNVFLVNRGGGVLAPGTKSAGLGDPERAAAVATAVDFDHDGDLDLHAVAPGAPDAKQWLHRNAGDGTFEEVGGEVGIDAELASPAIAWFDVDGDNAVDLLAWVAGEGLTLFLNDRSGEFSQQPIDVPGLDDASADRLRIAVGDVDSDLDADVTLLAPREGSPWTWILRNESEPRQPRLEPAASTPAPPGSAAITFADMDLDGHPELLFFGSGAAGLRGREARTSTAGLPLGASGRVVPVRSAAAADLDHRRLAVGDLDGDGDPDLVTLRVSGEPIVLWNELEPTPSWVRFALAGRPERSNPQGFGAKLTAFAGSLRQRVEHHSMQGPLAHSALPPVFGLGDRERVDGVSVLWPSGIRQAEVELPLRQTHPVVELDRQPSSCPMLYAWDGERFRFLTDCFATAPLGLWVAPDTHVVGEPHELHRLRPGTVAPIDGVLNLSIAEFLNESLLADRTLLRAADVDEARSVIVDEAVRLVAPTPEQRVWSAGEPEPPLAARLDGVDVTPLLAREDREVAGWQRGTRFLGIAQPHVLELDLAESEGLLVLNGSLNFSNSTNLFAAWQAGVRPLPPRLEVERDGEWQELLADAGAPAGFHADVVVDLAALGLEGPATLRLTTNLEVSWDRASLHRDARPLALEELPRVPLVRAEKRWLGVPPEVRGPDNRWRSFPRERLDGASEWVHQEGPVTPDGDVRDLVREVDGEVAFLRPGEELLIGFDARALPEPPAGSRRTWILDLHGWVKDADPHTARSWSVLPLPVPGRATYP